MGTLGHDLEGGMLAPPASRERAVGREHHQLTAGQQHWRGEGEMQALTIAERDPHDVPICGEDRGRA